ncbi:hypothetical protein, partial [uncultured Jatrophihabitans sp.]|uniref:hypothetical protein n=1 Tax=uncultured Jatrophihabitans sp. TaxID=1610747 RepID=UPI0035CC2184
QPSTPPTRTSPAFVRQPVLCTHHHHTFEAEGWAIVMHDGIPHCIPPPWIDPARKPIRNTAHHLPDIDFTAGRLSVG